LRSFLIPTHFSDISEQRIIKEQTKPNHSTMTNLKVLLCLLLLSVGLEISQSFSPKAWVAKPCITPGASVKKYSRVKLPSTLDGGSEEHTPTKSPKKKNKSRLVTTVWVHVVTIFIVANYRLKCWPAFLVRVPLATWSLLHAVSGMLFAGSIITTTILEWIVVSSRDQSVNSFWFQQVPKVEQMVVLPALTGSIISGVAQAFLNYKSLRHAPRHVKSSLHILFLFGVWWGVTDRRTQGKAQEATFESNSDKLPTVMLQRRVSNSVSCGFLIALYAVMVLKPGYL
jgi:hypothetical protein